MQRFYPIGTPGQPWNEADKQAWLESQTRLRSYPDEVYEALQGLKAPFELIQYGALSVDPERFPLLAAVSRTASENATWALVTGGVHGYETSGVQGALAFLHGEARRYVGRVNIVIVPCVSPWGYEVINRWNPQAIDPNRSFMPGSPCEESQALMSFVQELGVEFSMHVDLHETTDSDEEEFRPALAARDGEAFRPGHIPDGFYLVDDAAGPQPGFQAAIIEMVEDITHIADPDERGQIIGSDVTQRGVIQYPCRDLGLCAGMTQAEFKTTTEVYPDSPKATAQICNAAQVAALCGAFDFVLAQAARPPSTKA